MIGTFNPTMGIEIKLSSKKLLNDVRVGVTYIKQSLIECVCVCVCVQNIKHINQKFNTSVTQKEKHQGCSLTSVKQKIQIEGNIQFWEDRYIKEINHISKKFQLFSNQKEHIKDVLQTLS